MFFNFENITLRIFGLKKDKAREAGEYCIMRSSVICNAPDTIRAGPGDSAV
jgi:hypothetical protein